MADLPNTTRRLCCYLHFKSSWSPSPIPSMESRFCSSAVRPPLAPNSDWKCQASNDLSTLCREGRLKEALDIVHTMDQRGVRLDFNTYASLLQACTDMKALFEGKQVHAHVLRNGLQQNVCLGTKLVSMYANCGNLKNARLVFDKICKPNVFLWNAMIRGYARIGFCEEALELYFQMQRAGIEPDNFTFPLALKACAGLSAPDEGKEIHDHIVRSGYESDVSIGNSLVAMYAKCGIVDTARHAFDKMATRNVISWNAMISGYVQNGHGNKALELFHQMLLRDVKPNLVTMGMPRVDILTGP